MNHITGQNDNQAPLFIGSSEAVDFDALEATGNIEFSSTAGFLKRVAPMVKMERPWGMENFRRFSKEVGWNADSLFLLFRSATDPGVGPVRVFPLSVLYRSYQQVAQSLGWPKIPLQPVPQPAAPQPPEPTAPEAALEVKSNLISHLRMLGTAAAKPDVRACARKLAGVLERECMQIRQGMMEELEQRAA